MKNIYTNSSRYFKQDSFQIEIKNGKFITALKPRIIFNISGIKTIIKAPDRLDIIAQKQYNDPTRFWHIADANSELEANNLVRKKKNQTKIIEVPTN